MSMTEAIGEIEHQMVPMPQSALSRALVRPVEAICAVLLATLITLVFFGVIFRYFVHRPIIWIDELSSLVFLWLGMLGAVIALVRGEHLRLTLFQNMIPGHLRDFAQTFATMIIAAFLVSLVLPSIEHVGFESVITSAGLGIPQSYRVAPIAAGILLMLVFLALHIVSYAKLRDVLVSVAILAALGGLLWLARDVLVGLGQANILIFLVGVSALCLVLGVPIAFCFGIATVSFLVFTTSVPLSVMIGRMDEGMSSIILLSIPVFIFLGCILDSTGMGKAIVDFLASLIGHVRAGMSYVLLGSLFIVSGISGSKVSDMATVAPALFPEMKRRGNKPPEMIALLSTGAVMADTVPPSIVLIVLGSVAGLSIAALFTSGFVIAFVLLLCLAAVARWKAGRESLRDVVKAPWSLAGRTALVAGPALALPFLIRGAVGEGIATATEVSTVAVVYALIVGVFLYGGISVRKFYSMLVETAALSGAVLLIMGTALAMAWALTQTGFATLLGDVMRDLPGGWITFMLVSILTFALLGCLLEGLPALVLLAPLMFPIARDLGIHGIHYAMVVVVAMNIGLFTPPIGMGFYIACSIGRVSPDSAMRAVWVYLGALIAGLLVIALVPAISIAYL